MRSALAAMGTCLVLAAGCGGDEDGVDTDAFPAEANAICADYEEKIATIPPPQEDLDEWAAIAGDIGDLLEAGVNKLDALEPPGDLSERYDEWLARKRASPSATRDLQDAEPPRTRSSSPRRSTESSRARAGPTRSRPSSGSTSAPPLRPATSDP